ncbi:hypothetical protein MIB92_17150 [Aestuariirhabdus sp. Z084]|uniref:hypothetical protein n=1 Tax=Aestuariirhabdus haliotis TaxID=2918751 RepID=UPI00201B3764|nr:hypothetical protein [Aestuariirhabdus haliotis]MCL6417390.1 hypothetical protein [Aestuariirhabdus haliotis]MCL6421334.1 hypothetical protein [Aestuariirhabdus haliotis]
MEITSTPATSALPGDDARSSLRYLILALTFGTEIEERLEIDTSSTAESSNPTPNPVQQVNESTTVQLQSRAARLDAQGLSVTGQAKPEVEINDPLAIDLNGDGFNTTSVENGIWFDINGDGEKQLTSFVTGDDAFLALDRNNNGKIDSGKELFGDQHGARNGFEEARNLDSNGDGYLDAMDEQFHRLSLLSLDANNELQQQSLSDAGITRINLGYRDVNQAINVYDSIRQLGSVETIDGLRLAAADLMLGAKT